MLLIPGWNDWKKVGINRAERNQHRREKIARKKKIIKEAFQREQEKLTKRVHALDLRRVTELLRRIDEEEARIAEDRIFEERWEL